jgi:hypothetical protein
MDREKVGPFMPAFSLIITLKLPVKRITCLMSIPDSEIIQILLELILRRQAGVGQISPLAFLHG